jgi:hypothetical protein
MGDFKKTVKSESGVDGDGWMSLPILDMQGCGSAVP